ncbi:hypothetical protein FOZ61_005938 [Perkinsus olseni]|uniref:Uncharacterized protein n=1 Tax=Perkinsus olseni TaxID=32597 RepID=A0A7J6MBD0_PEROL|nr:hypothetical protein FOZ61_005938 [Perkinsus olseni]
MQISRPPSAASSRPGSTSTLPSGKGEDRGRSSEVSAKLAAIQSNIEEARGPRGRQDGISSKIRQLGDRVQRTISADQAKIGLISEQLSTLAINHSSASLEKTCRTPLQITKLRESLHSDTVAAELLTERMQKDLKLVESSADLDINALRQARTDSLAKLEKALNNTVAEITEEYRSRRQAQRQRKKDYCRRVAEEVCRLTAEKERLRQARTAEGDKIREAIEAELSRVGEAVSAERQSRAASEDRMLNGRKLEEICGRMQGEMAEERRQREEAEEQLIALLEDTCTTTAPTVVGTPHPRPTSSAGPFRHPPSMAPTLLSLHHSLQPSFLPDQQQQKEATSFLAGIWPNKCKLIDTVLVCRPKPPADEPSYVEPAAAPLMNTTKIGVPKICGEYAHYDCPPGARWPEGATPYPDPAKELSNSTNTQYSTIPSRIIFTIEWRVVDMAVEQPPESTEDLSEKVDAVTQQRDDLKALCEKLAMVIKEEESARRDITDECTALKKRQQELEAELERTRESSRKEAEKAMAEKENYEAEIGVTKRDMLQRVREFEGKMSKIREEVESSTLDNQRLAHEVLRLQRLVKVGEEEMARLKTELTTATEDCREAEGKASALQVDLEASGKAGQDMKLELDRCQSRVEALKTDLGAQRKARAKLEATVEALRGAVVTENSDKSTASRSLEDANKRIARLEKEKEKAEGQLKQMIAMVRTLEDTQGSLLSELETTTAKLADVGRSATASEETNVDALRKAAEQHQEVVRMRTAMLTLDRERDELQSAVDEKSEEISSLRATNRELSDRVGELNRKVEQLRREAEGQQVNLNSRDEEGAALQKTIQQLREETVRLRTELDGSQQEVRNITEDVAHMTRENQSLHAEVIRLSREASNFRTALDHQKRDTQTTMEALRAVELERDDVRELYHQATLDGHRRSASISTLQEERDQLEESLDLLTKENEKFQASLSEAFKHNRRLQVDLDATEDQNQQLLKQLREMNDLLAEQRRMVAVAGEDRHRAEDACRQLSTAGNHQSRESAKLATQLAAVTAENQRLSEKLREARHALHEESNRSHQLEDYLNDQRRRHAIGVVSPLHPSASDSSFSLQTHPEYISLCDTVEQQYKLIGEMDSTLVQLQNENAELKSIIGQHHQQQLDDFTSKNS